MGAKRVLLIATQHDDMPLEEEVGEIRYRRATVEGAEQALQAQPKFDAIVLDSGDGGDALNALRLLRQMSAAADPAPIILLAPPGATALARKALNAGAVGCVVRTSSYQEQLRWTLDSAIAHHQLQRQHRELRDHLAARSQTETEATQSRRIALERLGAALHHLYEGVVVVDARTQTTVIANVAAERLFGTKFIPKAPFDANATYRLLDRTGQALAPTETPIRQALANEQARIGERLIIERPDGIQVAVVAATVPLHDESGALREIISVYQEMTDQNHAQLVRDEVLSIASHELRTPLTVVLGYSSLLRTLPATQDNPRMQRAITKIYEQSLRMRELIEHLLDFSRIALGRTQLQWIDFDLNALVREVSAQQQAEAGARPMHLALPDEPLAMTGDYSRLAQALQQVIRAAWQQQDQREIVIAIHTGTGASFRTIGMDLPPQSERRYALIEVGRTSPDLVSTGRTNLASTDGELASSKALELTISAELVRLHGGALLVEPQASKGDAFSLLLPLQDNAPTQ